MDVHLDTGYRFHAGRASFEPTADGDPGVQYRLFAVVFRPVRGPRHFWVEDLRKISVSGECEWMKMDDCENRNASGTFCSMTRTAPPTTLKPGCGITFLLYVKVPDGSNTGAGASDDGDPMDVGGGDGSGGGDGASSQEAKGGPGVNIPRPSEGHDVGEEDSDSDLDEEDDEHAEEKDPNPDEDQGENEGGADGPGGNGA